MDFRSLHVDERLPDTAEALAALIQPVLCRYRCWFWAGRVLAVEVNADVFFILTCRATEDGPDWSYRVTHAKSGSLEEGSVTGCSQLWRIACRWLG